MEKLIIWKLAVETGKDPDLWFNYLDHLNTRPCGINNRNCIDQLHLISHCMTNISDGWKPVFIKSNSDVVADTPSSTFRWNLNFKNASLYRRLQVYVLVSEYLGDSDQG